jgi:isoleucyl-tRNA synthetase
VEAVGRLQFRRSLHHLGSSDQTGAGPDTAFRLEDVSAVSVTPDLAEGRKCARSWRITDDVGSDPEFPDVSARDAAALHELKALGLL